MTDVRTYFRVIAYASLLSSAGATVSVPQLAGQQAEQAADETNQEITAAPARQEPASSLQGRYRLKSPANAGSTIRTAIDRALQSLPIMSRPMARARLLRSCTPHRRLRIKIDDHSGGSSLVQVWFDAHAVNARVGTSRTQRSPAGERARVLHELSGATLTQTFETIHGTRIHTLRATPSGQLELRVRLKNKHLKRDIRYSLTYDRVA